MRNFKILSNYNYHTHPNTSKGVLRYIIVQWIDLPYILTKMACLNLVNHYNPFPVIIIIRFSDRTTDIMIVRKCTRIRSHWRKFQYIAKMVHTFFPCCLKLYLDTVQFYSYQSGLILWHLAKQTIAPISVSNPDEYIDISHKTDMIWWSDHIETRYNKNMGVDTSIICVKWYVIQITRCVLWKDF